MTCDDRQDLLLLYAAGGLLESAERRALRAHLLAGCPVCAGRLAEAKAVLAQMARSIEPVEPPETAIDQLMARIEPRTVSQSGSKSVAQTGSTTISKSVSREVPRMRLMPMLLATATAVAAAVAITSGVWFYLTRSTRSFLESKDLTTVALKSPTQPNARGQVLWARDLNQWRVTVNNLGPTVSGREYELWLIPAGGKPIRARMFNVDRDGNSTMTVSVPASVGALATAAITDEPLGGSDSPTGTIHLAGQFN